MNFIYRLFLLIFFFVGHSLLAQEWKLKYDTFHNSKKGKNEFFKDFINLPSGKLVMIGYFEEEGSVYGKQAILKILDPNTGKTISKQPVGTYGDDIFETVSVSGFGNIVVGGHTTSKSKQVGWLRMYDLNGNPKEDPKPKFITDENGKVSIKKIIWLNSGEGILLGITEEGNTQSAWLGTIDEQLKFKKIQLQESHPLNKVNPDSIIAFESPDGEEIWLCATVKDNGKESSTMILKIDRTGKVLIHKATEREAQTAFVSLTGNLLIGGEEKGNLGNSKPFLMTVTPKGETRETKVGDIKGKKDNLIAVDYSLGERLWYLTDIDGYYKILHNGEEKLETDTTNTIEKEKEIKFFKLKNKEFKNARLMKTYHETYLVAGIQKEKKSTGTRLMCFEKKENIIGKGAERVDNLKLEAVSLELIDTEKNGTITSGEEGNISITLKNHSGKPFPQGRLRVTNPDEIKGIRFKHNAIFKEGLFFPGIPARKSGVRKIGIIGNENLEDGRILIEFEVIGNGVDLDTEFEIFTKKDAAFNCEDFVFIDQSNNCEEVTAINSSKTREGSVNIFLSHIGENKISTLETEIMVKDLRPENLKALNSIVELNGNKIISEGGKSMQKDTIGNVQKSGKVILTNYILKVKGLKQGPNKIRILCGDYASDTFNIMVDTLKRPILHLLAIGAKYGKLRYTANDAQSVKAAVEKFKVPNGFFKDVSTTVLTDSSATTAAAIADAVAEIYSSGKILPNDYFMFFFSGHGDKEGDDFVMMPSNYKKDNHKRKIYLKKDILLPYLNKMDCKKFLFFDACLSDISPLETKASKESVSKALLEAARVAEGTAFFSSCSGNEFSYENSDWENGAFTKALVEAFSGSAILSGKKKLKIDVGYTLTDAQGNVTKENHRAGDDFVSIRELSNFLTRRVKDLIDQVNKENAKKEDNYEKIVQTPTLDNDDFDDSLPFFDLK